MEYLAKARDRAFLLVMLVHYPEMQTLIIPDSVNELYFLSGLIRELSTLM